MKRFYVFLMLAFVPVLLFGGHPLKSFDELMIALREGKRVSVVIEYKKCQLISDNEIDEKVPDAIGGMEISTWEYFAKNAIRNDKAFVVTSESKLIERPREEGYVYNYVKLKVSDDNKVKVTARYLDAKTFEVYMDENFFGVIDDGKNEGGARFYCD